MTLTRTAAGILFCILGASGWADKTKVLVYQDINGCPTYTRTHENNCGGEHRPDESCRKPGQNVRWEVADKNHDREFDITFEAEHPFENCQFKSNGGKIAKCKIRRDAAEGDYVYKVSVDDCENDPRIVVRH